LIISLAEFINDNDNVNDNCLAEGIAITITLTALRGNNDNCLTNSIDCCQPFGQETVVHTIGVTTMRDEVVVQKLLNGRLH